MQLNRKLALALLTPLLLNTACTTKQQRMQMELEARQTAMAEKAFQQMTSNDFRGAAASYQHLAEQAQGPDKDKYLLLTTENLLRAGLNNDAKTTSTKLDARNLNQEQRYRLYLAYAQMQMEAGKPDEALKNLDLIPPDRLSDEQQMQFYRLSIAAHEQLGQLDASTFARIRMARQLNTTESRDNTTAILDSLILMPQPDLLALQSGDDRDVAAWADLTAIIEQEAAQPAQMSQALRAWQEQYPGLPVDISYVDQYASNFREAMRPPETIAVLLPQSGPYADAAMAIRRGIITAYYQGSQEGYGSRPALKFYDSEAEQPYALYQRAVAEGADFVIGPLNKEKLQLLSESGEIRTPVLALNEIPGLNKPNLFQFSLRPEDDVEQAASSAWFDGYQNALVLIPATAYGDRIGEHFEHYWQELGGTVLETGVYNTGQSDFSETITQLLDLDESEARYQELRKLLPGIEFEPRTRDDADFIFLLANPGDARMIRPQLQFFRASRIPVYATSQVYSGRPHQQLDQDLTSVIFCDIPWLFEVPGNNPQLDSLSVQQTWKNLPDVFLRLTALGIDAYNLIPHLRRLQNLPASTLAGSSGTLTLAADNHVKRQLYCAQFDEGLAQPRGWAPHLKPASTTEAQLPQAEVTPVYEP